MKKPVRNVLLILLFAVIAAFAVGIWQWNKPHKTVDGKTGIAISTDSIVALYNADETSANARFLNKVIAVSGITAEVGANADGQQTVLLKAGDAGNVFCTMRKGEHMTDPKAESPVIIKGFCSGKTMDDIKLTDCVLMK